MNPIGTSYGYKGQWGYYRDMETGLLLLTHRYFDPVTGRFLTRDPIGVEGGVNLYAYVGNGVVIRRDPFGMQCLFPPVPIVPIDPQPPPLPAPPFPPSVCVEYDRLCKQGHWVACLMVPICKQAGDSPWSNCVRGCLLRRFRDCRGDWFCEWLVYLLGDHPTGWIVCLDYAPQLCIPGMRPPVICRLPILPTAS